MATYREDMRRAWERMNSFPTQRLERALRVGVPKDAYTEGFLAGACPIVGSYGGKDRANRGTARKLAGVLEALGVEHDVKGVPGGRARVPERP